MAIPLQYATPRRSANPRALKAAAWVFFTFGVLAAVGMAADLSHGKLSLNFDVLGLFVCRGLLRQHKGWRTCGLVLLWFDLISTPIDVVILLTNATSEVKYDFHGLVGGMVPVAAVVVLLGLMWLLVFWQYRVLTRSDVRALFLPPVRPLAEQRPW